MSNVCEDRAFRVSTGSQRLPQFSISQVSTLTASFEDDVGAFGTNYPDSPRDVCIREGFTQAVPGTFGAWHQRINQSTVAA